MFNKNFEWSSYFFRRISVSCWGTEMNLKTPLKWSWFFMGVVRRYVSCSQLAWPIGHESRITSKWISNAVLSFSKPKLDVNPLHICSSISRTFNWDFVTRNFLFFIFYSCLCSLESLAWCSYPCSMLPWLWSFVFLIFSVLVLFLC